MFMPLCNSLSYEVTEKFLRANLLVLINVPSRVRFLGGT
jgi:hypothetical protein